MSQQSLLLWAYEDMHASFAQERGKIWVLLIGGEGYCRLLRCLRCTTPYSRNEKKGESWFLPLLMRVVC